MKTIQLIQLILLATAITVSPISAETILVNSEVNWRYLDDGSDQETAWKEVGFDDSNWSVGQAKLGFGDNNNNTTINNHQSSVVNGAATWYFRHKFNVVSPSEFNFLKFEALRDDGVVVYLNGVEVGRSNMPAGTVNYDTLAASTVGGSDESTFFPSLVFSNNLVQGENVLAVEVHQRRTDSSDVGFDLRLLGTDINLTRGPYLQSQSPTEITIKWRTFEAVNSRVSWGSAINALDNHLDDPTLTTEHELRISGLSPKQTYYYSIGTNTETYAGNTEDHHFNMPPLLGDKAAFRFWVIGDSGTANADAQAVKNAYLSYNQQNQTNLWLMLGDNAYNTGTDDQYQTAVFDMYPELLRNSTLWSTIGNHDRGNANSIMQTGVYYDIFSFPQNAQTDGISTGMDSGTEAYYSFDYANVHFVVLESHESNATFRTGMLNWLNNDLLMTDADWVVAVWHHPPYTKGSHDSDLENQLIYMRENVLPILENHGVDLVLTGHSHSYERSWLIDGHYGHSDTFDNNSHIIDGSPGTPDVSPYEKNTFGMASHEGAVYVVAGSSGKISDNQGEAHEAMRNLLPLSELGSLVIDVNGNLMSVRFLNDNGQVSDAFQILKADIIFIDGFENNL
ncbi:MAG: metallophosphoesterase family protein [Xanthomonadales bacterium]|nr:metallophosphoesterase family protein [Xanthomonadales bacterium]